MSDSVDTCRYNRQVLRVCSFFFEYPLLRNVSFRNTSLSHLRNSDLVFSLREHLQLDDGKTEFLFLSCRTVASQRWPKHAAANIEIAISCQRNIGWQSTIACRVRVTTGELTFQVVLGGKLKWVRKTPQSLILSEIRKIYNNSIESELLLQL